MTTLQHRIKQTKRVLALVEAGSVKPSAGASIVRELLAGDKDVHGPAMAESEALIEQAGAARCAECGFTFKALPIVAQCPVQACGSRQIRRIKLEDD